MKELTDTFLKNLKKMYLRKKLTFFQFLMACSMIFSAKCPKKDKFLLPLHAKAHGYFARKTFV